MIRKRGWDKSPAFQLSLDCRARRSGWADISSAFTALLNCAEVGRRNRILTNYRFLSHSPFYLFLSLWTYNRKKQKRGPSYANHVEIHFVSHYLSPSKLFLNSKGGCINHHAFYSYFNLPYNLLILYLLSQHWLRSRVLAEPWRHWALSQRRCRAREVELRHRRKHRRVLQSR